MLLLPGDGKVLGVIDDYLPLMSVGSQDRLFTATMALDSRIEDGSLARSCTCCLLAGSMAAERAVRAGPLSVNPSLFSAARNATDELEQATLSIHPANAMPSEAARCTESCTPRPAPPQAKV